MQMKPGFAITNHLLCLRMRNFGVLLIFLSVKPGLDWLWSMDVSFGSWVVNKQHICRMTTNKRQHRNELMKKTRASKRK